MNLQFIRSTTVLAVADTTTLHFAQGAGAQGLGPVGSSATQSTGLFQHSLLAFTPAGLLTNEPVRTLAQARRIVEWYGVRWGIEGFHKVLKSGGALEAVQLKHAERWQRYLATGALRFMASRHVRRFEVFPQHEIKATEENRKHR